jgi:TPR repeat protein
MSQQKFDVFISYSRKDTAIADQICEAFDKHGITYFIDRQGIGGGLEFPDVLADAICDSGIFLYLASNNSYDSKFTKSEVTFAFNEKPHNSILPYIIDGSTPPRGIRFTFASINWRNIKQHPIEPTLVKDVCGLLGKTYIPQTSTTMSPSEMWQLGIKAHDEQNYAEAVKWFRKAAEQGQSEAQYNLGWCYYDGLGVEQSYSEAVKWVRKAAEQGHTYAQNSLGFYYHNGLGVEQSYYEATKWFRKAAEQGHANAQCNLGLCYDSGQGVEQSYSEAAKWFRKAAEQGDANAQCNLGVCYEYGQGVEQNYSEAVKWYRKAAEQGDANAQHNLGVCYDCGRGVQQNLTEAVNWYRKAAEQGVDYAKGALKRLGYKR